MQGIMQIFTCMNFIACFGLKAHFCLHCIITFCDLYDTLEFSFLACFGLKAHFCLYYITFCDLYRKKEKKICVFLSKGTFLLVLYNILRIVRKSGTEMKMFNSQ